MSLATLSSADERRTGIGGARPKPRLTASALARRRYLIGTMKGVLPAAALALLASVALWPQLSHWADQARLRAARAGLALQTGQLSQVVYHGVDQRGRPYTVTASEARQVSPQRIDLTDPKGDISLEGGSWLMVQSRSGTYLQHIGNLDLSGDVQLYRDDGTVMLSDSANIDLKSGAAASGDRVHAEGPFGTLDAQGFALLDRGTVIQFTGPGHLVLNAKK
jgi:lipopolysaccharide export system protein LptC